MRAIIFVAALLCASAAQAADPAWCRDAKVLQADPNGPCLVQRILAEEEARKAGEAQALERARQARIERRAQEAQEQEDRRAAAEAARKEVRRMADLQEAEAQARQATHVAELEKQQQERMAWDAENAKRQSTELDRMMASDEAQRSKAQKACGADFGIPRVGMTLDRAKQCLGYAKLVGQVNRKDGVASVYTNGRVQLFVMEGKVVAWQAIR